MSFSPNQTYDNEQANSLNYKPKSRLKIVPNTQDFFKSSLYVANLETATEINKERLSRLSNIPNMPDLVRSALLKDLTTDQSNSEVLNNQKEASRLLNMFESQIELIKKLDEEGYPIEFCEQHHRILILHCITCSNDPKQLCVHCFKSTYKEKHNGHMLEHNYRPVGGTKPKLVIKYPSTQN